MSIAISVRDFRGAERVDIACAPLCLLAGSNAQGKTSVAQAVAAALTGAALPIPGMTKKDAGALVRVGTGAGSVEIRSAAGSARVSWPGCEVTADGDPPRSSRGAAGLDSLLDFTPEGRARFLAELLHTDPTREDFAAAMADKGLGDDAIVTAMWKLVTDRGWDQAHALRKEKGAEMKGRWCQAAGARSYGSKIAASWLPPHWTDDLDAADEPALAAAATAAKEAHRAAIATAAAGGARREALEAAAGKVDDLAAALAGGAKAVASADAEVARLRTERDALPPTHGSGGLPCPHCGNPVIIVQRNLADQVIEKAPPPVPEAELKERRRIRAELDGNLSNAEAKASQAKRNFATAEATLAQARSAKAELDKLPNETTGVASAADAEAAATRAEQRLAAFKAKTEADAIRDKIASNDLALEILAADGLRARKLARVLDVFNGAQLAPLSDGAGWKPVTVGPEMAVAYGGRDVRLLSASEQYRVRAVLQVAVARIDGSTLVVLDAADILDAPTRSGLFSMLAQVEIPALVAMTLSKREQVPDLSAAGLGGSWWISGGIAESIGAGAAREAA